MTDTYTYSTTRPLFGKVAIITGASRGIGRAIATTLAKAGAYICVNYRHSEAAALDVVEMCRNLGTKAIPVQADVTDEVQANRLILAATELGTPTILVNNAGIAQSKLLMDTSLVEWDNMLASNLTASFLCTKAVLPHMMRAGTGRVINISSIWGIAGGSCEVAYSAAKGGLIAYTKALAKEVGKMGITVNAVAPGAIETDMLETLTAADKELIEQDTPVGRLGNPADVAHCVLFLASPSASYMTGQVISPNGGLIT